MPKSPRKPGKRKPETENLLTLRLPPKLRRDLRALQRALQEDPTYMEASRWKMGSVGVFALKYGVLTVRAMLHGLAKARKQSPPTA